MSYCHADSSKTTGCVLKRTHVDGLVAFLFLSLDDFPSMCFFVKLVVNPTCFEIKTKQPLRLLQQNNRD